MNCIPNTTGARQQQVPFSLSEAPGCTRELAHLGLIADGTRRWAAMNKVPLSEAYFKAVGKINELSEAIFEEDTIALSLYLLSINNLRRDAATLEQIFAAEKHMLEHLLPPIATRWQCRMIHAGNPKLLPPAFALSLEGLCSATNHFHNRVMYLCVAYDPIQELAYACETSRLTGGSLTDNLWVTRSVDLIVRTGGERRTSGFLPLQSGYAELYFCDKLFPDFTRDDMKNAYNDFRVRQRRHGT